MRVIYLRFALTSPLLMRPENWNFPVSVQIYNHAYLLIIMEIEIWKNITFGNLFNLI